VHDNNNDLRTQKVRKKSQDIDNNFCFYLFFRRKFIANLDKRSKKCLFAISASAPTAAPY
jgi:hypothetical protein